MATGGSEEFFYLDGGVVVGPMTRHDVETRIANGSIRIDSPFRSGASENWETAKRYGFSFKSSWDGQGPLKSIGWVVLAIGVLAYMFWPSGFSDSDIKSVKDEIIAEYKKQGIEVKRVEMLKKTNRELSGFVSYDNALLGSLTLDCSATMADSGGQYIWRCGL